MIFCLQVEAHHQTLEASLERFELFTTKLFESVLFFTPFFFFLSFSFSFSFYIFVERALLFKGTLINGMQQAVMGVRESNDVEQKCQGGRLGLTTDWPRTYSHWANTQDDQGVCAVWPCVLSVRCNRPLFPPPCCFLSRCVKQFYMSACMWQSSAVLICAMKSLNESQMAQVISDFCVCLYSLCYFLVTW